MCNTSGSDHCDSIDTSREKVSRIGGRLKESENGGGRVQGSRRSLNAKKNGALIMGVGDIVHGGGRGNLALINLVGAECKKERV